MGSTVPLVESAKYVVPMGTLAKNDVPAPGIWGFVGDCGTVCTDYTPVGTEVARCDGSNYTSCNDSSLFGSGFVSNSCLGGKHRPVCAVPQPTWQPSAGWMGSPEKMRNCCLYDYGNGQNAVGNFCGTQACPSSGCCTQWAAQLCAARGKSLSTTSVTNPDPTEDPWAIKGELLCDKLRQMDIDRYADVMNGICFDPDGSPSKEFARRRACLDFFNDPQIQAKNSKLETYCQTAKVVPDPATGRPADDDLCGCFRAQSFYTAYGDAVAKQWNIPPGLIDSRPGCSYPGCRSALVQKQSSVTTDNPCKKVNIAVCLQQATVNANGQITGNVNISQDCPSGSGITARGTEVKCATDADCLLGQQCDPLALVCKNPSDTPIVCTSDSPCVAGMKCGPVRADKNRYCQMPSQPSAPTAAPLPPAAIAAIVIAGVVLIAAGALFIAHRRQAGRGKASANKPLR